MLSEQRKCQSNRLWSDFAVNPRGELWKKDKQNLGCKLMKKMGWKKGSGLGKNENGITAPIRTVQTHDNEGLGYSKQTSDYCWNWLSHQDDYTTLLKQLQTQHWVTDDKSSSDVQNISTNVPQQLDVGRKAKTSRKRDRYQRNIEGKRMNNRSEAEWQCVLGKKRTEQTVEEPKESSATDSSQGLLVTSTVNSHAYFMQKKLKLDTANRQNGNPKEPDASEEEKAVTEDEATVSRSSDTSHSVNKNKKKKKRKPKGREKRKKLARQQRETSTECESRLCTSSDSVIGKESSGDRGSTSSESRSTGIGTEPLVKNDDATLEKPEAKFQNPKSTGNKAALKYQCFLECIKNDPIFQTCNLLSIKGYGNR